MGILAGSLMDVLKKMGAYDHQVTVPTCLTSNSNREIIMLNVGRFTILILGDEQELVLSRPHEFESLAHPFLATNLRRC